MLPFTSYFMYYGLRITSHRDISFKGVGLMANIRAFRAHRYDMGRVGNMSEVVAPPYDVIDEKLQEHLYNNNPYNVIRLELNK